MGVGAGFCMYEYDIVVRKSSRSLSHLLMSSFHHSPRLRAPLREKCIPSMHLFKPCVIYLRLHLIFWHSEIDMALFR